MHLTSFTLILGTIIITTQTNQASGINFACPDLHQNTGQTGAGRVGEKWTNNVKSWEDCSALCQTRSGCKYWTWHHANSGYWANKCVTMTDAGGRFYNKDVLSGERSCTGGTIKNPGKDCWHACGSKSGQCNDFCGSGNYCCRQGSNWIEKGCDGKVGGKVRHECTSNPGSCVARKPSKIPCYQIRDRKTCLEAIDQRDYWKSPCGWCFGKYCPGTRNLCEPKKWFDNSRLKAGQDYEDCLKLSSCVARKPSNIPCWQIRDRKTCLEAIDSRNYYKSPCGWCFGKYCPGTPNLCEPKKWFDDMRLKAGQDYEDCLKLGPKSECKNIKLKTNIWGQEISWKFGSCQSPAGYGENVRGKYANHRVYNIRCCQPPGTYELDCKDKFGDGWNGGSIEIAGREYCKDFRAGRSKKQQVRH